MDLASLTQLGKSGRWLSLGIFTVYLVGVGGTDAWLLHRIARYIREKHADAWKALGINSPYPLRFLLFVRNKDYVKLQDLHLDRMFVVKKRFDNITGVLFVLTLGAVIFTIKSDGTGTG